MLHTRYFIIVLLAMLISLSCKKSKNQDSVTTPTTTVTYDDYTAFRQGNYWIYQRYGVDSSGVVTPTGQYDSCFVEKDTVINNNTYHKYWVVAIPFTGSPQADISFIRDSLSYTVNVIGRVLFSSQDFTSVFRTYTYGPNLATPDTFLVTEKMGDINKSITVNAGQFSTCSFIWTYTYQSGPKKGQALLNYNRYAKNVGLVIESLSYFVGGWRTERRLERYHIEKK